MAKESSIVAHAKRMKMRQERAIQSSERLPMKTEGRIAESSTMEREQNGEIMISIPLSDLIPDPNQARLNFSKVLELMESIKLNGLLQPIIVIKNNEGKYIIKDGECRWRAMKSLAEEKGQDISTIKINAICKYGDVDENIGTIMNILRNNYTPFEIAIWIKNYKNTHPGITLEQIGKYINKSRQNVGEYLNLLRLPEKIQNHAIGNNIIPFYILKQLAANPRLSEQEKIQEYGKLLEMYRQYNPGCTEEDEEAIRSDNEVQEPTKINKKFNVINKKIDTLLRSFEKFKVEDIVNSEDRQLLLEKLEIIIANANKLKNSIEGQE